jgi:cytochrome c oxidase subunit 4
MSSNDASKEHGLGFYVGILAALLVLTVLTYVTARQMHTGVFHTPLALTIALVKGSLVVWFFMHLGQHAPINRAFFATALVFVTLMIGLIVGDVATRPPMINPNFPAYKEVHGPS